MVAQCSPLAFIPKFWSLITKIIKFAITPSFTNPVVTTTVAAITVFEKDAVGTAPKVVGVTTIFIRAKPGALTVFTQVPKGTIDQRRTILSGLETEQSRVGELLPIEIRGLVTYWMPSYLYF